MDDRKGEILGFLFDAGAHTTSEIARRLGMPTSSADRHLKGLQKMEVLDRNGQREWFVPGREAPTVAYLLGLTTWG